MQTQNKEIEVRFLEIDKAELIKKIVDLGGTDHGETMLEEIIFKSDAGLFSQDGKFVRLRNDTKKITLCAKDHKENLDHKINDIEEIEFEVSDFNNAKLFMEKIGLHAQRFQEKLRHTFHLENTTIDIDTWPNVPTYVELEADTEEKLKIMAEKLDLPWDKVIFESAGTVITKYYNIPVTKLKYFTFDRFE